MVSTTAMMPEEGATVTSTRMARAAVLRPAPTTTHLSAPNAAAPSLEGPLVAEAAAVRDSTAADVDLLVVVGSDNSDAAATSEATNGALGGGVLRLYNGSSLNNGATVDENNNNDDAGSGCMGGGGLGVVADGRRRGGGKKAGDDALAIADSMVNEAVARRQARYVLGKMLLAGEGGVVDRRKGLRLLRLAASEAAAADAAAAAAAAAATAIEMANATA